MHYQKVKSFKILENRAIFLTLTLFKNNKANGPNIPKIAPLCMS